MSAVHAPAAVAATSFRDATEQDWEYVTRLGREVIERDAGRAIMDLLRAQKDVPAHGWQVSNYQHSLQAATRALRNGETEEYIVCCLLHDVTQDLNPYNHDKSAGDLLRYHVSDENHWIVANHQIFQLSFRDHSKFDKTACERFRGHPHFEAALRFCEMYDMNCFDGAYEHLPIETFEPMVYRVYEQGVRAFHAKHTYPPAPR
jgi:predicted HD phosphohydrolase